MSLLLDALKKAAQQKAQKSKSEEPVEKASDETLLEHGAVSAVPAGASGHKDETELDLSEINARLERGSIVRGASDETGLDVPDRTDARIEPSQPPPADGDDTGLEVPQSNELTRDDLSELLQTGDDEASVFESDDGIDFAVEHDPVGADVTVVEDETDLNQRDDREDLTGIGGQPGDGEIVAKLGDDDETDLNREVHQDDLTGIGGSAAEQFEMGADDAGEETDLGHSARDDRPGEQVDETDLMTQPLFDDNLLQGKMRAPEVDETDLSQSLYRSDEDAGGALPDDADLTDFNQPAAVAEQTESVESQLRSTAAEQSGVDEASAAGAVERGAFEEDLSLLLLEPDPTNPQLADTEFTDSRVPGQAGQGLAADASDGITLELVDNTETLTVGEQTDTQGPTLTNPSVTEVYADDTRAIQAPGSQAKTAPGDTTSTRTYAPDNYDRTLMKLPSNDVSKLFAGMKSDSDVVMTPDYAKKVFRSKTSAQRVQHYKLYGGIATVIVLSISLYGVFQYQDESFQIDTSLRPLKRDPMPGVIKTQQPEETNLFSASNSGSKARTIKIIETAETAAVAETGELGSDSVEAIAITAPVTTTTPAVTTPSTTTGAVEWASVASGRAAAPEDQVAQGDSVDAAPTPAGPATKPAEAGQVASLTSPEAQQSPVKQSGETAGNLQIESSSQYRESDIWLRDAYAAYGAGNDQQALRLYNQVVETDPGNRNALLARAAINIRNGAVDPAIRDYKALLLANPKDSQAMASLLAVASLSPLETESQLKLMIYDEPDSPFLNFALANAYGAQNRWQEAQQYYFKALQTNPQDPNYAYNLAVSLEHISQPTSAVTYYRRALDNFGIGLATFDRDIVMQRLERLENL